MNDISKHLQKNYKEGLRPSILIKIIYLLDWKYYLDYNERIFNTQWSSDLNNNHKDLAELLLSYLKMTKKEKLIPDKIISLSKSKSYLDFHNFTYSTFPLVNNLDFKKI